MVRNRVRRQSGFPTFIPRQRQDAHVLPKRRQSHQGDKLCDVSTVPLVARWPVFLARGSDADGEPHSVLLSLRRSCWVPSRFASQWHRTGACVTLPTECVPARFESKHRAESHQQRGVSRGCGVWQSRQWGICKQWRISAQRLNPEGRPVAVLRGQTSHHQQPCRHCDLPQRYKVSSTGELCRTFRQILPASATVFHDPGYQRLKIGLGGTDYSRTIVYCSQKVVLYQCRLRGVEAAKCWLVPFIETAYHRMFG